MIFNIGTKIRLAWQWPYFQFSIFTISYRKESLLILQCSMVTLEPCSKILATLRIFMNSFLSYKDCKKHLLFGIDKNDCLVCSNWNTLNEKILCSKKVLYKFNNYSTHPFKLLIELQKSKCSRLLHNTYMGFKSSADPKKWMKALCVPEKVIDYFLIRAKRNYFVKILWIIWMMKK